MSQIVPDEKERHAVNSRRHTHLAIALIVGFLVLAEEVRYGYILGNIGFLCKLTGGSYAPARGRCFTRACSWFYDCGNKLHPTNFIEHIAPGDSSGKVMFWLGMPVWIEGDVYYWVYGKGDATDRFFSTTFQDGKFVKWDFEVDSPRALKPAERSSDVAPATAPEQDRQ